MSSANTQKKGGFHYAFMIVAACIVFTCIPCALTLSCAGIYFTPVSTYFGVPKASFTLYFTILNLAMMITLPIAGKLMSKMDMRVILTVCAIIDGLAMVAMSFFTEVWMFYVSGVFLGIGTAPLLYLATPSLINAWCYKKVGFFIGLAMAFTGIGGVIFNPIGTALINMGPEGWRTGYLVFGILILVLTTPFTAFVIRSNPADKGLKPYGIEEALENADGDTDAVMTGVSANKAMKTGAFVCIAAFAFFITLNQTVYQFMPSYCTSFAESAPAVAALSGVVASACMAGQAIGKVVLGVVNDKNAHAGLFLGLGCGFVAVALMWFLPTIGFVMLIAAFIFGFVYACTNVEAPLLTRSVFGSRDYTNIWSRVSMAGTLGGVIAPTLFGILVDLPGGFNIMFAVSVCCMIACLLCGLYALGRRGKLDMTTGDSEQ
ncbi:MAG: MFS transporter [Coriobacteriia bacterium]|nr:MFS transporter [Coriobacteriia bacterium]